MKTLKTIIKVVMEMANTPVKKWGVITIVTIATAIALYSCGTLKLEGENKYEYYKKGKNGETIECSQQK